MNSIFVLSLLLASSVYGSSNSTQLLQPSSQLHPAVQTSVHMAVTSTPALKTASLSSSFSAHSSSTKISPTSATHSSHVMTSTAVPTSTTKPTTTMKPTTTPKPEPHFVVNENGSACLTINGTMSIFVNTSEFQLVKGAVVTGHCRNVSANVSNADITMTWKNGMMVMFQFMTNKDIWFLSEVVVNITNDKMNVTAMKEFDAKSNDKYFQAPANKSYSCPINKTVPLSDEVKIDFVDVKIQPFKSTGAPFDKPYTCPSDTDDSKNSNIVPIAVGCALAGLIVIVLIAYLIGRRKNDRGYQQV